MKMVLSSIVGTLLLCSVASSEPIDKPIVNPCVNKEGLYLSAQEAIQIRMQMDQMAEIIHQQQETIDKLKSIKGMGA